MSLILGTYGDSTGRSLVVPPAHIALCLDSLHYYWYWPPLRCLALSPLCPPPKSTACKSCPPGTFNSNIGSTSKTKCTRCDAGSYQPPDVNGQQQPCAKCQAGTFTDTSGQSTCSACAVGKYAAAEGQTVCDTCAIGKSNPLTGQTSPGVSSLAIALSLPDAMHVAWMAPTRHDRIAMGRCVCGMH